MKIENPASCEIRSIKFLNAKNIRPAEIYRQVCEVYGENAMSDGMVRRRCRMFSEGRTNVHDGDRNGRPSLVTADLLDQVNEKIRENKRFTMSEVSTHFPHFFSATEQCSSDDDVKTAVQHWVKTLAADFFNEGIQKLVPRYDKCLNLGGDYVEKYLTACELVKIKKYLKCFLSIHLQPIGT
jgi:hypothetical protein